MNTTNHLAEEFPLLDEGRLFVARTGAKDVVVVEGSVFGGPRLLPRTQDMVPLVAASLLDAGTATKGKKVIRETLARKGASLQFSAEDDRLMFSARCFPEDLSLVLTTAADCLNKAVFPPSEVKNIKTLMLGDLIESETNTGVRAARAFSELVYDPTHSNYWRPLAEQKKSVAALGRNELVTFKKMLGTGGILLSVAGDVNAATVRRESEKAFSRLGTGTHHTPIEELNKKKPTAGETLIAIPDKSNVDVCMGVAIPITMRDPLYYPLLVLVEMLGGGSFTSHLMQTIRERDGLTYSVYARLAGFDMHTDGALKIGASFSPNKYAYSVAKVREEIETFFTQGLTEFALAQVQERIIGSYTVALSTTLALANALHRNSILGRDLSYLTDFPDIIRGVTHHDLLKAADLVPRKSMALAAAGTFSQKKVQ